jgi:hypothetical protein
MKPHRILTSFKGNQTGIGETEEFEAGTVRDLSDHLAENVVRAGWAEPLATGDVAPEPDSLPFVGETPPEQTRETKVTGPQETKPEKSKKAKKVA